MTPEAYRRRVGHCEACLVLHACYPVNRALEVHHIYGGNKRLDERWNYVVLCRRHHELGTTHSLQHGPNAWRFNLDMLAIKYLKREIDEQDLEPVSDGVGKLSSIDTSETWSMIRKRARQIADSRRFRQVVQLGWFRYAES